MAMHLEQTEATSSSLTTMKGRGGSDAAAKLRSSMPSALLGCIVSRTSGSSRGGHFTVDAVCYQGVDLMPTPVAVRNMGLTTTVTSSPVMLPILGSTLADVVGSVNHASHAEATVKALEAVVEGAFQGIEKVDLQDADMQLQSAKWATCRTGDDASFASKTKGLW